MAKTPSDQHVIWNRVTTASPAGAQRGPSRTIAIAYPAAKRPTNSQTSGCGVQVGRATAAGINSPASAGEDAVQRRQHDEIEQGCGDRTHDEEPLEHRLVGAQVHEPRRDQEE